jgi:aminopeptidase
MKDFYLRYADLAVKIGVNLQKGQRLEIVCPTEREDFALILAETAYKNGAKTVRINWENQKAERLDFTYAKKEDLCQTFAQSV